MRVYVYPADLHGCGYHRLIWPAEQLIRDGHNVTIVRPNERNAAFNGVLNGVGEIVDVQVPADAEVIVLQRITHRHIVKAIPILRSRGIAVVMDMDDDLAAVDPRNPAFAMMHPRLGPKEDHSWHHAQQACDLATYVTVSTPALLHRYARHGRGEVLFNCVPRRYLDTPRVDSTVIGWAGSTHSHPDDLQVVGVAVAQVTGELGSPFHVVGDGIGVQDALRLSEPPTTTGPQDPLEGWPTEIARIGIGITPLVTSRFNDAKSWLKPLEYAALGVPCVVTPGPEYVRLHRQGVGLTARKPREWLRHLRALTSSAALRAELSARGREVAARWTVEGNADRWAETWKRAFEIENG